MSNHTEGPWISDVNAKRIVECVNAMEGIDDPAAARVVLDLPQTQYATDLFEKVKAALCLIPFHRMEACRESALFMQSMEELRQLCHKIEREKK